MSRLISIGLLFFIVLFSAQAQPIQSSSLDIGPIRGELCFIEESIPNVLLIFVPNSGPVDRNGNQSHQRSNVVKKLAEDLAVEGITSYRYDKILAPRKGSISKESVLFEDYIQELERIIAYFQKQNAKQQIVLVGYGEGSLVSLVVANTKQMAGLISIAGYGQTIDQAILQQMKRQVPALYPQTETNFALLKKNKSPKEFHPALDVFFGKQNYKFMQSWMKYAPNEYISSLEIPTLILHGKSDLQVDFSESELLYEAQPNAKLVLLNQVNHVLRDVSKDDMENAKTYNRTDVPISYEVFEEILDFLVGNFK
jgi:esterase/lipase